MAFLSIAETHIRALDGTPGLQSPPASLGTEVFAGKTLDSEAMAVIDN
jgi:hypothetical protein